MSKKNTILFIITEDWYYLSHRKDLALFGKNNGFHINVLTKINNLDTYEISKEVNIIDWNIDRASTNIFRELKSIKKIFDTIRKVKPDIVHSVGLKPIIYSGILSIFFKKVSYLYAFAGLGSIFINTNLKKYLLQKIIVLLMKFFFKVKKSLIVFQNNNDYYDFNQISNLKIKKKIIQGSGIDPQKFKYYNLKNNDQLQILLPSRLLYDKGIEDFIYCASEIKKKIKEKVVFVIAGKIDKANPSSVQFSYLKKYINDGIIEWLNNVSDISKVYDKSHIVCFPSFREGNPKALLEAACCELPIISYDVPGCNDIVKHKYSGILIPFRDKIMMKEWLEKLIFDVNLRNTLGKNARKHVIENFSNNIVFNQYLTLWKNIL